MKSTALQTAHDITGTGHGADYGEWTDEIARVCTVMNTLYTDLNIKPNQATMFMIVLKQVREAKVHKADNIIDMSGYSRGLADVEGDE